ncbi:MAG: tRNA-guanine transglycosylase [Myxococcota bacterium]|nr:tRNA-guanine transglycosylase [Myxococcota bacterium]
MTAPPAALKTRAGLIQFPAYLPVTTFGGRYPLDALLHPYLPRLAQAAMVSLHYALQRSDERLPLPLFVDSGGFASLFERAELIERGSLGAIAWREFDAQPSGEDPSALQRQSEPPRGPEEVLAAQERLADVAFTLDFPIPPRLSEDQQEREKRLRLTVNNARWAIKNRRRRDLPLYACVQGWDLESYRACAEAFVGLPFDGIAIGGLVPRARDEALIFAVVDAVRALHPESPLHLFGLGRPELVRVLFQRGVQSIDSSAYVRLAAEGRRWGVSAPPLDDPAPLERLEIALSNLAYATQSTLPLSAAPLLFCAGSAHLSRDQS